LTANAERKLAITDPMVIVAILPCLGLDARAPPLPPACPSPGPELRDDAQL